VHLVGFIIRICHDALSSECEVLQECLAKLKIWLKSDDNVRHLT